MSARDSRARGAGAAVARVPASGLRAAMLGALAGLSLLAVSAVPALASTPPSRAARRAPLDGKALFHEKCAMCHGPGGMGTGLLGRRYHPAELVKLVKHLGLSPAQVIAMARIGIGNMPAITRGEVSNAQIRAIAAYLVGTPAAAR